MAVRAAQAVAAVRGPGTRGESVEVQEAVKHAFETIGMAKVSTSALEARKLGLLRQSDIVVPNRDRLVATAKAEALRLASEGYAPQASMPISAPGVNVRATLQLGAYLMRQAEFITEHELKIAQRLAHVLCGGDVAAGTLITEDYLLDLEREAFLSLCGERKTQERIQYTLKTGKTLRN
jgi:3-hydroxyacyl-CoA dehydrogenase